MTTYVPAGLRRLIAERSEGLCEYCLFREIDSALGFQVEHIISEKHGGPTILENLAFACVFCNRAKGSDIASLSPKTGQLCRLFNPRTDLWSDHFVLEPAGQTLGQRLMKFAGTTNGLPKDMARNHDHYIHGTPQK